MPGPFEALPETAPAHDAPASDPCASCQEAENKTQAKARAAGEAKSPLRVVFMGTPDFAARILERLVQAPFVDLSAVFSQPDRPAGRGKKTAAPPVKLLAQEHGLRVLQPLNFKPGPEGDAAFAALRAFEPDVLVVAAYGLILPQRVLDVPRLMPVNVHGSLLPKYRGAAPVQRAIMSGDAVTGVTIMRMEAGLDTGPILMQRAVGIDINDTSATLMRELAEEGADLLLLALERLRAGALQAVAQDEARASHAPKLTKEEGLLDFSLPGKVLHARIRGLTPWPGPAMRLEREGKAPVTVMPEPGCFPLTASMREAVGVADAGGAPGRIIGLADGALLVACGDGAYAFTRLKPAGGKSMDAAAFANGYLSGCRGARFTGHG